MFLSTFEKQVDSKHRLLVPAEFRERVEGEGAGLYCFPSLQAPCLEAGGEAFLHRYQSIIDSLDFADDGRLAMEEAVFGTMHRLAFDAGGRITLPEDWREPFQLQANGWAAIVGLGDRFQIWSREAYRTRRAVQAAAAKSLLPKLANRQTTLRGAS